jgi:hypothetical protein
MSVSSEVLVSQGWATNANKTNKLKGAVLVDKLISDLQDTRQAENRNKLVSIQLSAVSISYLLRQFTAHIPYKIGVDPSQEQLIQIGGINAPALPSPETGTGTEVDGDNDEFDITVSNLGVSSSLTAGSSLNFFGRRTQSSTSASISTRDNQAGPAEPAAHGLIEDEVDPLEVSLPRLASRM